MSDAFAVISLAANRDPPRVWIPCVRAGPAPRVARRSERVACHEADPTWRIASRVMRALAAVAAVGLVGCGEVYLGERTWKCSKQAVEYDATDSLYPADRFWRFNDETMGREITGRNDLVVAPLTTDGIRLAKMLRIGGEGAALITDIAASSNQSAPAPYADKITLGPRVTYATWISLPKSWLDSVTSETKRMVLISTMKPQVRDCGGHELTLQGVRDSSSERVRVSLGFAYFDANCQRSEIDAEIEQTPALAAVGLSTVDAWGLGKWYHVAASVNQVDSARAQSEVRLYWDSVEVSRVGWSRVSMKARTGTDLETSIHVGSDPTNASRFEGYLDDVALLQRALGTAEIQQFRQDSISKYGLDGLRWFPWDVLRSSASWAHNQAKGLALNCEDGQSSGCGVMASLDWRQKVADLDHVVLSADLPAGKVTDFLLSADQGGRQFCKWSIYGRGGADYYLSVKQQAEGLVATQGPSPSTVNELKWCRCDDCDCTFDVRAAAIGSEWTTEVGEYPCLMCGLQRYESVPVQAQAFKWSRGAKGPNGFCWRPIAYDVLSHARFTEAPTDGGSVKALLSGPGSTTALLAADFGVAGRSLGTNDEIVICAYLPKDMPFQIMLKSANEGYCQVPIIGEGGDDLRAAPYPNTGDRLDAAYCTNHTDDNNPLYGEDGKVLVFDATNIRYLGIQKAWAREVETTIRIDSVRFNGDRKCNAYPQ